MKKGDENEKFSKTTKQEPPKNTKNTSRTRKYLRVIEKKFICKTAVARELRKTGKKR